ncbi:beta-lactamase family protein [Streptomyces kunmingensis]|uniref:Beta-lactamase family protein n=1 Tax=Streptomyces kunmingensis TaxID=68225 RepID=A0ABU6C208_9ACTN|nr:serine hydrolase [Streptomyces kunmingensis]MEB3958751.1 beta-lactamase family protein [Streptomyces kunmingensis]
MSSRVREILLAARENRSFSAAAWSYGDHTGSWDRGVVGTLSWDGDDAAEGSHWDLASVTKPIVATAVMSLVESGELSLEDTAGDYLHDYPDHNASLKVRDLLTHTSGLPGQVPLFRWNPTSETLLAAVRNLARVTPPGTSVFYSSQGYIVLGLIAEAASGLSLDQLVRERVFSPAGMANSSFGLPAPMRANAVATEDDPWRGRVVQGEVHDENAAVIGRAAGHAGIFSTLADMELLGQALCSEGLGSNGRILSAQTYRVMSAQRTDHLNHRRTLGWMGADPVTSHAGDLIGPNGYGHNGFTGTSLWIDPDSRRYSVLLTNRVHPSRSNTSIARVRTLVNNVAFGSAAPTGAR